MLSPECEVGTILTYSKNEIKETTSKITEKITTNEITIDDFFSFPLTVKDFVFNLEGEKFWLTVRRLRLPKLKMVKLVRNSFGIK